MRARIACRLLLPVILACTGGWAAAQGYPVRPVKIIAPNPPGGGFDFVARVVAPELSERLGQPFIVENRTGAGTLVGTEAAAKSPPDGYTLLVGGFSNLAANTGLYRQLSYDPLGDFVPAGMVVSYAYVLVSRKDLLQRSLREIVEFARANPGKLSYASAGVGTGQQIAAAVLARFAGVQIEHIPYRGAQAAYQDLLSGRVDLFFDNAATAKAYIDDGRVKAFAVSSGARFPGLPDLPTVGETGVASMELESWFGIFGRSGTPAPLIERLRVEMAKAVQSPGFVARFEKSGGRMLRMSPAEADAFVRAENGKWSRLIREAGITAE
jgi:tripartite-type tricarboxylate transporter receptor subunit TctC